MSRSSLRRGSQEGGEPPANALVERDVDPEPLARLGYLALSTSEGVLVQPGERSAHSVVAGCDKGRQRVEHAMDGVWWPQLQHFVPVMLDGFPSQDAALSTCEDASQQIGSVLRPHFVRERELDRPAEQPSLSEFRERVQVPDFVLRSRGILVLEVQHVPVRPAATT